jgi:2-C-methyl-D-erythritol 4-phosphate cytidylyltransferase
MSDAVGIRRTVAILLCAGRGERLGAELPKALVPLAGRPLFTWSLEALQRCEAIDGIVLVGPVRTLRDLLAACGHSFHKIVAFTEGGDERQHSVGRGLHVLPDDTTHVAVHDSARALVTPEVIARAVAVALEHGAALAAVPQADTLKQVTLELVTGTVPRAGLWAAQTPQVFRRDWLERAHREATELATDDAALIEWLGHPVHVSLGDALNFKITTAADRALAEAWLVQRTAAETSREGA